MHAGGHPCCRRGDSADPDGRSLLVWPGFHGKCTANGETFNTNALTAAHKTLPFGTKVRVTNERTGKSVVVRINDRGPYAHGRVIDLSKAAAEAVGISGVGQVTLAKL
jgi:rare lipoprotein A